MNELDQMGYPFLFEKIIHKNSFRYVDIVLGPSGKRLRFQMYRAEFVISNHYDIDDKRYHPDIGYKPIKGLQNYDFCGVKEELFKNSIFETNIMKNIFSYVDFIYKDVITYTISSEPDLVSFESRIPTLLRDGDKRRFIFEILMELKEFYNPYEHFINYVVEILQHKKIKEGEMIYDVIVHPSYSHKYLIITPIEYTKTNSKGTFHCKMNIGQNKDDLSPIGISITNEELKSNKKIHIGSQKGCNILMYEDIDFFITYDR